ncbi:hypothetical protein NRK67_03410 [Fusobacteria bacterium ZRK30]|nr:hypothetical protein NRK67_03410 [Fusobacteria bacterium ZRK30]
MAKAKEIMEPFSRKTDKIYMKIRNNDLENQTLIKTRDTLLPKLMSGEVRIK